MNLSITNIIDAGNLNYGEGFGNVLNLKKLSSGGKNYSYISRQAIRYDLVRIMNQNLGMPLTTVDKKQKVVQFASECQINEFPEIDLFGYMKTDKGGQDIRKAPVRLSDAVSLEPFNNEIDFSTNMGLANRIPKNVGNDIFQSEIHKSLYSYTITVELDRIGKDENDDKINISNNEKAKRINDLLTAVKLAYRDIRGKRENLAPIFSIGGVYDSGNPLFYNRIKVKFTSDKILLNTQEINSVLNIVSFDGKAVKEKTIMGCIESVFSNIQDIEIENTDIETYFKELKQKINSYYGVD